MHICRNFTGLTYLRFTSFTVHLLRSLRLAFEIQRRICHGTWYFRAINQRAKWREHRDDRDVFPPGKPHFYNWISNDSNNHSRDLIKRKKKKIVLSLVWTMRSQWKSLTFFATRWLWKLILSISTCKT